MNVVNNNEPRNTQNTRKGVLKRVFSCISWFVMICAAFSSYAGVEEATSPVFGLSVKHDGVRQSAGVETLTYSSQWDGGDGATVTIAENGAVVADGLSGEGTRSWSVTCNGTYVLTHTTYTNGVAGKVETATFVVTGKDVAFAADDVSIAGFAGKYDGAAHGVDVMVKDGIEDVVVRYAAGDGAPALPWSETAPTITDVGSMTVWCEIAAPGYITQTNSATVVISPREVTLTSGSASKVYDGTALVNGNVTVGGDGFVDGEGASYNVTGSQTNVGDSENAFVYTLNDNTKAGNYNITTVNGRLTVTKANVGGGTSGGEEPGAGEVPQGGISKFDASFVYDGEGHTIDTNVLVVAFGSAMVGESAIEYAVDDGSAGGGRGAPALPWLETAPVYTNAGEYVVWYRVTNPNYEDFVHAAKLSITKRPVTVAVAGHTATFAYDTTEKTVSGYDVATEDALYDIAANTVFSGAALASRTDVGMSVMGLSAANFANKNENFEVTYLVSDGWLKIEPRIIGDDPANWDIRLDRAEMYDGTEKSAPIIQVAFVKPDGNLDYIPYTLEGNTATDAGNYKLRITGAGNYSGTVEKDWAITPRNVTLASGGAEWVYDGEAHSQSAVLVIGDGFAAGEGASYSGFPVVRHVADAATPRSNTFEYTLNVNTKAQNYVITTANGTVKMSPRVVTLTAPTKQKQYDGTPLTFGADEVEITETGHVGRVTLPNGEVFTLGDFASITEAGRVDATFTVADGTALMADYAITIVTGTLTVMKNATEITVTAKSGVWKYDSLEHTLHDCDVVNGDVLQSGDELVVEYDTASRVTTPDDGEVENRIVSVKVMRGGAEGEDVTRNYSIAVYPGTLRVVNADVSFGSVDTSAFSTKVVYDGEGHTIAVTAPSLLTLPVTVTYAETAAGPWRADPMAVAVKNAGTHTIRYRVSAKYYNDYIGEATVVISPRKVTVSVSGKTATFPYDKTEKSVEGYDIVSGDALYDVSAGTVFSGTAKAVRTVAGTTAMNLASAQFSNVNGNFTVTYAVTDGWVKIEKSTFNPQDVFGGNGSEESPLVCEKVYDGSAQGVEIKPNFNEEYRFVWSLTKGDDTSYSEMAPTLRNVADGELTVYFKFVTENYEPYYGKVIFRIHPKTLTDEMVVLTDEAFFYDPGSTVKKPSVTVSDTNAVGVVISTVDDYTVVYDEATSAGAIPVTVTGKNNYTGTVTKTFDVLKRPVAPPVIGSKSYNAKDQTATIPVDERWMVVKNDGGINAGEYAVILRLTNSNDYMWKGTDGKSADWTGVFVITRSANGWSRSPGITNWTEGETPSEPVMGTPRRGTTSYVTYRKRGADVSTAVREKPTRAGKYTARFVVEESENYVGTYRDVDFEILPGVGGFTETETTPVPVPYVWLDPYLAKYGSGDYESAGNAKGANGCALWESYVAGLDPEDATSKFMAKIEMGADGKAVITWTPDLSKVEKPRKYTTLGKEKLGDDAWSPVTDGNKAKMRFFKVTVEMK